jgi:DNA repair photolyase
MEQINARSIFSPATGYIRRGGFDWTCNPYVGCSFGCTYCYAMFLPQNRRPKEDWGKWFQGKTNALALAGKEASRVGGQAVYMSSVTDPYLPAERSLRLSRGILEVLRPVQPRLLVQTRGPLVVRDIDLLTGFAAVRINFSIPTDDEDIRQAFEPKAPPLGRRWEAVERLKQAGLPVGICVTPMLPLREPERFAERLISFGPDVLVTQDFQTRNGAFGAHTGEKAQGLLRRLRWAKDDYARCLRVLRQSLTVYEGEAGFFPPGRAELASPRSGRKNGGQNAPHLHIPAGNA